MSDPMSDKDPRCGGCVNWAGSYAASPCDHCATVFSGTMYNYFSEGEEHITTYQKDIVDMKDLQTHPKDYDNVTNPKHYQLFGGEKQVIDLINDRLYQFANSEYAGNLGELAIRAGLYYNIQKYTNRWFAKEGVKDLRKARQYLDMLIEELN